MPCQCCRRPQCARGDERRETKSEKNVQAERRTRALERANEKCSGKLTVTGPQVGGALRRERGREIAHCCSLSAAAMRFASEEQKDVKSVKHAPQARGKECGGASHESRQALANGNVSAGMREPNTSLRDKSYMLQQSSYAHQILSKMPDCQEQLQSLKMAGISSWAMVRPFCRFTTLERSSHARSNTFASPLHIGL